MNNKMKINYEHNKCGLWGLFKKESYNHSLMRESELFKTYRNIYGEEAFEDIIYYIREKVTSFSFRQNALRYIITLLNSKRKMNINTESLFQGNDMPDEYYWDFLLKVIYETSKKYTRNNLHGDLTVIETKKTAYYLHEIIKYHKNNVNLENKKTFAFYGTNYNEYKKDKIFFMDKIMNDPRYSPIHSAMYLVINNNEIKIALDAFIFRNPINYFPITLLDIVLNDHVPGKEIKLHTYYNDLFAKMTPSNHNLLISFFKVENNLLYRTKDYYNFIKSFPFLNVKIKDNYKHTKDDKHTKDENCEKDKYEKYKKHYEFLKEYIHRKPLFERIILYIKIVKNGANKEFVDGMMKYFEIKCFGNRIYSEPLRMMILRNKILIKENQIQK